MSEQIYIGNNSKGQINIRTAFNIDNDAFPLIYNFYTWRGRVKRKPGTEYLGQCTIQVKLADPINNWELPAFPLVAGGANFIGELGLESTVTITPGVINISVGGQNYTDSNKDGTLQGSSGGIGTINYATGAFAITGGGSALVTGFFSYYPGIPVLGIEDFLSSDPFIPYPQNIVFDQENAYQFNGSYFYNVSYYKNTSNPFNWSGEDYQQFWSTNYSSAFWATNNVPGMHFQNIVSIAWVNAQQLTIVILDSPLIIGDYIWLNEITTNSTAAGPPSPAQKLESINGQTGIISTVSGTLPGNITFTVNFPNSTIIDPATGDAGKVYQGGIAQYLTHFLPPNGDGIRWYDGDPTAANGIPPASPTTFGWVNFAPPLTATTVSINNYPTGLYYLVGALMIQPFKDRLLFFGCWIQTSTGEPIYLQDTVIWSWNGTPYYTDLTPTNQQANIAETGNPTAYYVDQTGKGGYLPAGTSADIVTLNNNEDVLLIGFTNRQTRFIYTGNDINPFLFFNINSELGATCTFSGITLDQGGITIGSNGIAFTDQQSSQRLDLDIPDSVFRIQANNHGAQRVNAVRDYFNEFCYFAYPLNTSDWTFPTNTFLYNYRDRTWAILYENFTTHGTYRRINGFTWQSVPFPTWEEWLEPWDSGENSSEFPAIAAGNPQGFVLVKTTGSGESPSGTIQSISNNDDDTQIMSSNHCVQEGDYLYITGALGVLTSSITAISQSNPCVITSTNTFILGSLVTINDVTGMTQLNGNVYKVIAVSGSSITINVDSSNFDTYISGGEVEATFNDYVGKVINIIDLNNFVIDIPYPQNTYKGLGQYTRLSQPLLQTKQFNSYWQQGRQIRLSKQQYLFDYTTEGQVTLNIYLSQNDTDVWNDIATPSAEAPNSLIYSQLIYTCPESTNLGLSPANVNLQNQLPASSNQLQIWHRMNTSLIGDTIQIGITLSDSQMRNIDFAISTITLHSMILAVSPSSLLS